MRRVALVTALLAAGVGAAGSGASTITSVATARTLSSASWTKVIDPIGPSPRTGTAVAATRTGVLLFGGSDFLSTFGDTWMWLRGRWNLEHPRTSPSPRSDAALATIPGHGALLFGGGTDEALSAETWRWTGTTWRLLHPRTAPSPRIGAAMAWDATNHEMVLFGGEIPAGVGHGSVFLNDTWVWRAGDWVQVHGQAPPARSGAAAQSIPDGPGVLLFGGRYYDNTYTTLGDMWVFSDDAWRRTIPQRSPPSSDGVQLARGPRGDGLMFVTDHFTLPDHFAEGEPPDPNQVWLWGHGEWTMLRVVGSTPQPRSEFAFAFDPIDHEFVLFGGYLGGEGEEDDWIGDTWTLRLP